MEEEAAAAETKALADDDGEQTLWRAARKGDGSAREALFSLHLPFAQKVARRHFYNRKAGDIELADLFQLASAGLLEAIDHFDISLGAPFKAYASRRISGSVLDGVGKMSELREQISFRNRMRAERARSLASGGVDAMDMGQALDALTDLAVALALGFMLDDSALCVAQDQPDLRASAYESLAWKEAIVRVTSELDKLPQREQTIIRLHYLQGVGFDQVAEALQLSKGRVSQLHRAALTALRKRLTNSGSRFRLER